MTTTSSSNKQTTPSPTTTTTTTTTTTPETETTSLQMQVATPNSAISSSTTSSPSVVAAAAAAAVAAIGGANNQPSDTYTQLILDHPLYPLLEMVFQKCELATSSPRDSQAETICSSDSFSEDIRNFINTSRLRDEQLTTGCHDVDEFMLKSIEVLRIHLLELEKVHQLCDNFCQRYINCLKGKLPIDLVVDDGSSRDTNSTSRNGQQDGGPSSNTTPNNNNQNNNQNNSSSNTSQNGQSANSNNSSSTTTTTTQQQQNNGHHHSSSQQHHNNNNHHHPHQQAHHDIGAASNGYPAGDAAGLAAAAAYHQSYGAYGPTGYAGGPAQNPYAAAHHAAYAAGTAGMPHYQTPGDHHSSMKHESSNNTNHHHHHHPHHRELTASSGSSSASSVKMEHGGGGANGAQYGTETNSATTAPDRQLHDDVRSPTGSTGDASMGSGDGTECEDDDNRGRRQQKKRGIFPKAATNIMRAWLFQHLNHPYPSEDQKKQLAEETGLTILQVNNWFINARRRIVQPMIDQSNRTSGNIMAGGPAYSPDGTGMGYMLDGSQPFRSLPGVDSAGMNPLAASHAAMTSAAMGAYSAASAQHLSQYGRQQQSHAAMLGLSTPPTGPHMMGAHPTLPPHDYY